MSPRRTLSSAPSECRTLSRQSGFCTTPCVTGIHFLDLDLTNHQYHHHDSSPPCPSLIDITFLRELVRLAQNHLVEGGEHVPLYHPVAVVAQTSKELEFKYSLGGVVLKL